MTDFVRMRLVAGKFLIALLVMVLIVPLFTAMSVSAQDDEDEAEPGTYWDPVAGVEIPGALGQTEMHVWVPQSRHTIRGYMLDYWRAQGAASVYGNPVSEPFAARNGYYSQAFEGGIFQFRPEYVWSDTPSMTLMPLGNDVLRSRTGEIRRDGKRAGGGGDRRASAFRTYSSESGVASRAAETGGVFDPESGHSVVGEFQDWYMAHEGDWYLGSPLSQPVLEHGMVVQYFEGAVLKRSSGGKISVAPTVSLYADTLGLNTRPVEQSGLPEFSETLLWTADNPNPLGDPFASGKKWIDINLSTQTLSAYQGGSLISSTLVSTGLDPNGTDLGNYHVRYKLPVQDMAGTTNADGEVVALGEDAVEAAESGEEADQEAYTVDDVPNVLYINMESEALHGAYWHNNFGAKMSHGCVNLPLDFADWIFGWAPLGTQVLVHE